MDAATRALLMEELQSKEPARQEQVAQVLESMGQPSIPILMEVIKQEKDFRTRQLAAGLLGKMGREAAEQIKREVVLEVTAEQRFRILEVIDVVTRDLRTELAFCLSDVNPKVRRAAFRLSERLADKQVLKRWQQAVLRSEYDADACARETLEETAHHIRPTDLLGVYRWHFPGADVTFLRFAFCGEVVGHEPQRALDREIRRAVWLTPDEIRGLRDRHRSPLVLACVEDYLAGRRYPLGLIRHFE